MFAVSLLKWVSGLRHVIGDAELASCQFYPPVIEEAYLVELSLFVKIIYYLERHLPRHRAIWSVEIEQFDFISAQSVQRGLERLAQILRRVSHIHRWDRIELGVDD